MNDQVLIVEDSLTVRMNLHEALEQAGVAVISCGTIEEARRALSGQTFALVILDMILPDGEGTDLLQEIRQSPERAETSVMLLSAETEVRERLRALNMGADDYVGKPYDLGFVINRTRELLEAKAPPPTAPAAAPTVLVIDDSLTFRVALKGALEHAGYRVLTAESGEAGLRIAGQLRPSALIVDGMMDGIDGATVIRRVRLDVALRNVPCLLLTASEGKSAEIEALEAGADAFVIKNDDTALVLARLAAILRSAAGTGRQDTASLQAPKRVLAVDDSETYLQELAGSLRGEGYDVILARSGEEALDLLAVQQVDCILLDLVMPGLGGHDVCRRLKANPLTRHIPVLILTAREDQESTIEGLSAGADDYIAKSSEFQVLRARVLAQLRRKQFEDENRNVRERILHRELEAAEARAAKELAEARAALVEQDKARAEASEKAKGQFLAAMSHEIRTPMNGVIGIVELLAATQLTPEQRQMVELIRRSGISLLDVINDILDYSKIEVGRMTIEKAPFSLVDTVETTAQLVAAQAQSKPIEVLCFVDPAIDEMFIGDPVRVRQVILNMMGNAVKFTERGSVRVDVHAETFTADEVTVLIEVSDTGVGMTPQEQTRLFKPFQQANQTTTRKFGGTGLGLSISKNLVELMGGQIGVRSTLGKGSTFWFRLLFARCASAEPMVDYTKLLARLRVLVYCGKGEAVSTLYLRSKEAEVLESTDFDDAVRTLETETTLQQPADLLIVHAGFETKAEALLKKLKERPKLAHVKTILILPQLTAERHASDEDTFTLTSPIRRQQLYDLVAFAAGRTDRRTLKPEAAKRQRYTAPDIETARKGGGLVLVAEDSKTNQFVILNQLKHLGIACELANDGGEAWEMLERNPGYGLLLTDCHMPEIDGYQLTALVRDHEVKTERRLPIVALTANALAGEAEICRASGMDDYLSKPTSLDALERVMARWLPAAIALRTVGIETGTHVTAGADDAVTGAVNLARLKEITPADDPTFIRTMLGFYRESEAASGQQILALIEAGNADAVRRAAHAAKGAARTACATTLADLCDDLERTANIPDWAEIKRLGPLIDGELRNVMSFIERYLRQPD